MESNVYSKMANLVPMVTILVIFYMVTATYGNQRTDIILMRPCSGYSIQATQQCDTGYQCDVRLEVQNTHQISYYCNYIKAVDKILDTLMREQPFCKIMRVKDYVMVRFTGCGPGYICEDSTAHYRILNNLWFQPFKCKPDAAAIVCATRTITQYNVNYCPEAVTQLSQCTNDAVCLNQYNHGFSNDAAGRELTGNEIRYSCDSQICKTRERVDMPFGSSSYSTYRTMFYRRCDHGLACTKSRGPKYWPNCTQVEAFQCETWTDYVNRQYNQGFYFYKFGYNTKPCGIESGGNIFETDTCPDNSLCILLNRPMHTDMRSRLITQTTIDAQTFINSYYCFNVFPYIEKVINDRYHTSQRVKLCRIQFLHRGNTGPVEVSTCSSFPQEECVLAHVFDKITSYELYRAYSPAAHAESKIRWMNLFLSTWACRPISHY